MLREYQVPIDAEGAFLAKPWPGMTINRGCEREPVECRPHKDSKDAFYGYSCVFPFGEFTGGDLILWELEAVIAMAPGDALFFPAHLITHSNGMVTGGIRHSLVAYAPQETMSKDLNPNAKYDTFRRLEVVENRGQAK